MITISLPISEITRNPDVNIRELDEKYVNELAESQLNYGKDHWQQHWKEIPKLNQEHILFSGFHTIAAAHREFGNDHVVEFQVVEGNPYLLAACENASHGKRRTNAEKRAAVLRWLEDDEGKTWSDEHIAKMCHVSVTVVRNALDELLLNKGDTYQRPTERKYVDKHDNISTMDTQKITNTKKGKRALRKELVAQLKETGKIEIDADDIPTLAKQYQIPRKDVERMPAYVFDEEIAKMRNRWQKRYTAVRVEWMDNAELSKNVDWDTFTAAILEQVDLVFLSKDTFAEADSRIKDCTDYKLLENEANGLTTLAQHIRLPSDRISQLIRDAKQPLYPDWQINKATAAERQMLRVFQDTGLDGYMNLDDLAEEITKAYGFPNFITTAGADNEDPLIHLGRFQIITNALKHHAGWVQALHTSFAECKADAEDAAKTETRLPLQDAVDEMKTSERGDSLEIALQKWKEKRSHLPELADATVDMVVDATKRYDDLSAKDTIDNERVVLLLGSDVVVFQLYVKKLIEGVDIFKIPNDLSLAEIEAIRFPPVTEKDELEQAKVDHANARLKVQSAFFDTHLDDLMTDFKVTNTGGKLNKFFATVVAVKNQTYRENPLRFNLFTPDEFFIDTRGGSVAGIAYEEYPEMYKGRDLTLAEIREEIEVLNGIAKHIRFFSQENAVLGWMDQVVKAITPPTEKEQKDALWDKINPAIKVWKAERTGTGAGVGHASKSMLLNATKRFHNLPKDSETTLELLEHLLCLLTMGECYSFQRYVKHLCDGADIWEDTETQTPEKTYGHGTQAEFNTSDNAHNPTDTLTETEQIHTLIDGIEEQVNGDKTVGESQSPNSPLSADLLGDNREMWGIIIEWKRIDTDDYEKLAFLENPTDPRGRPLSMLPDRLIAELLAIAMPEQAENAALGWEAGYTAEDRHAFNEIYTAWTQRHTSELSQFPELTGQHVCKAYQDGVHNLRTNVIVPTDYKGTAIAMKNDDERLMKSLHALYGEENDV